MKKKTIRKKAWCLLIICMLAVFETGCGNQTESAVVENVDESAEKEESSQPEEADTAEQPQRTDAELKKLELTLDLRWNVYEELRDQDIRLEQLKGSLSEEQLQELVQSEILRCYEENTLLAVEIKTVVMGSLGCTVPTGFSTGEDVMKDYGDYVKNTVLSAINVQGVIDDIASPQVQEVLKNGVEGAIESYRTSGSLEDALSSAADSITYGVAAGIQEQAEASAVAILDDTTSGLFSVIQEIPEYDSIEDYFLAKADEKTGGLIGSLEGIMDYDTTPGALLQEVSDSANRSVQEIKVFLDQDVITSKDIDKMMYEYSLFGNAMQTLFQYGGSGYFEWKPNYDKMETLYKRFLRNEVMIEILSSKGEITNPVVDQTEQSEGIEENTQVPEYIYEKPVLTAEEELLDNNAKFDILTENVEKLDNSIAELKSRVESVPELTLLEEYRHQVEEVNTAYEGILAYSVQNFEAVYDEQGIRDMQDINKKNHAIGEIAKYTPYGIVVNLLTSSTIASNDAYYSGMQTANEAFGNAYQEAVLKARDALSALEVRIDFYEELVAEYEDVGDEYTNMCLLKYMLGDSRIDVEQYGQEVKKDLYILALQADAMDKIYGILYSDIPASNSYAKQYNDLMRILDPEGTGEIAALVSDEERAETLLPILEAGILAIGTMEQNSTPNMENKQVMVYKDANTPGGIIYCCFLSNQLAHVHHRHQWIDIYYSKGAPLFINGYYVYDGIFLNGVENADCATACEEAEWIRENIWANTQLFQEECSVHVDAMKQALRSN